MTHVRTVTDNHGNAGYTPVPIVVPRQHTPLLDGHNHPLDYRPDDYHVCPGCTATSLAAEAMLTSTGHV